MALREFKNNPSGQKFPHPRSSARHLFAATAEAVEPTSQARVMGRTMDLSRGGCYLDSLGPFPVGTFVTLRITHEDQEFKTNAKVVFSQTGIGMGIAFTNTEPEQLWILEKWLGKLSGEMPAEMQNAAQESTAETAPAVQEQERNVFAGENRPGMKIVLDELIVALLRNGVLTEMDRNQLTPNSTAATRPSR